MSLRELHQVGNTYVPAAWLADKSVQRAFYGSLDPSTVAGVSLSPADLWGHPQLTTNLPPVQGPVIGQPDGAFVRWADLYVSGDTFRQTFARFTALGKLQYLIFPQSEVVLPSTGFTDPDSSVWYLGTLVKGFGGEGTNRCLLTLPVQSGSWSNQSGTTQYTAIRQNNGPITDIWGCDFRAYQQPNVVTWHGITTYRPTTNLFTVKDCTFTGFGVGTGGAPPLECFQLQGGMDGNNPNGVLVYARLTFDGRIAAGLPNAGTIVSGVGATMQRTPTGLIYGLETHHNLAGAGYVNYECQTVTINDLNAHDLGRGSMPINSELMTTLILVRPILSVVAQSAPHITFSNNTWSDGQIGGGNNGALTIVDPTYNAAWPPNNYLTVQAWGVNAGHSTLQGPPVSVTRGGLPVIYDWVDPSASAVHHIENPGGVR